MHDGNRIAPRTAASSQIVQLLAMLDPGADKVVSAHRVLTVERILGPAVGSYWMKNARIQDDHAKFRAQSLEGRKSTLPMPSRLSDTAFVCGVCVS